MLNDLEINEVALLTNNPDKVKQLEEHGIVVKNSSIGCWYWPRQFAILANKS